MSRSEIATKNLAKDFYQTFTTDAGKRILDHLRIVCWVEKPSYNPARPDSLGALAFAEGLRAVYWSIQRQIAQGELLASGKTVTAKLDDQEQDEEEN